MDGFLEWFHAFIGEMLDGIEDIISGIMSGLFRIFNIPGYIRQFTYYRSTFGTVDLILSLIVFAAVFCIWGLVIYMSIIGVKRYIRLRKAIADHDALIDEAAALNMRIEELQHEKEQILGLKLMSNTAGNVKVPGAPSEQTDTDAYTRADKDKEASGAGGTGGGVRFFRLCETDRYYTCSAYAHTHTHSHAPADNNTAYNTELTLRSLCELFRNFACSRLHLFYDIKTVRLAFAGLSVSKLLILQGISGTGKTSLPYSLGKFMGSDASICAVQPSWRDRGELFGYFNEFTKKFNETDFLTRVYSSSYNDDVNIIVLDEMNIARVEYYFAEMLSVLEIPEESERRLTLIGEVFPGDPLKLAGGKLTVPPNVWYIGTANNDDSTYAISDKVYDRAFVIDLDNKCAPFDAPDTPGVHVSYSALSSLYSDAVERYALDGQYTALIYSFDSYITEHFRITFGNRIMKQIETFVPVYVACGGNAVEGIDHMLATKVLRKFDSLNFSLLRDGIPSLRSYMNELFSESEMPECRAVLDRLEAMY